MRRSRSARLTLGLETSCDETSAALVERDRVLSNCTASSLREHARYGGVVPEIASRAHLTALLPTLDLALRRAKRRLSDVDEIAVTAGPGLLGSLLVGVSAAKALALALRVPLVGVDHVLAHAYSARLCDPAPAFPYLALVVSGGHTTIIRMDSPARVSVLGRTLDDASGEAFDKVAKILGLGYPGGPAIDRLSRGQAPDDRMFSRPYLSEGSLDFSFSGLKTAVYYKVQDALKTSGRLTPKTKRAMAAGFQEAVCDVLVKKALRACARERLSRLAVGGGVSANTRLRAKLDEAARRSDIRLYWPSMAYCQDNAAMIAAYGAALRRAGRRDTLELGAYSDFSRSPLLSGARS
ncbi:MAG: tRNA N6-adenosine threonylcarbamoyltransferase [Candidatus Omnitrophica bacterium]|nr:tRNA N6-adenosine threonylcarbamoyltransferase [Candidatus Omnitrophota bacterium]